MVGRTLKPATYAVFTRTWWRANPAYPDGLEPAPGRKSYRHRGIETQDEARRLCREINEQMHGPGLRFYEKNLRRHMGRKAEFEEE